MLNNVESLDLLTEIDINNLYNLMKTASSSKNLELLSKLQEFPTYFDFFKFYTNLDINLFFDFLKKYEQNCLNICNDNYLHFNSYNDKYISIYSNIILLFNFILKSRKIIKRAIIKIKDLLIKYYSTNIIDSELHAKINQWIDNLLNISLDDDLNKNNNSHYFYKNTLSTANVTNTSIYSLFNEKTVDNIFSDLKNEDNIKTPYFVSNKELKINNIEITNNNNNNYNFIICKKKDSVDSIFNLPCVNCSFDENDIKIKENNNIYENKKDNTFMKLINSNKMNDNSKQNINNNIDNEMSKINPVYMYKVLLKNINELYKNNNINSLEKIKIKQLIINKSPKCEKLYYFYMNNNIKMFIEVVKNI